MLIEDLEVDPDVPNAEHILEPQVRMIIEAMIEPAMELALHGVPISPLEFVMIHPIIDAKSLRGIAQAFEVFLERHQDIVVLLLVCGIIFTQPATDF